MRTDSGFSMSTSKTAKRTEVLKGKESVLQTAVQFFSKVQNRLDICTASLTPNPSKIPEEIVQKYLDITRRGGKLRLISNVTKANIGYCKELMKFVEVRHRDDVSSYFGVSEKEFLALPGYGVFNPEGPILYSNEEVFVGYQQEQFDMLWENATPAHLRINELEQGTPRIETKIVRGEDNVLQVVNQFLLSAASGGAHSFAYGVSDINSSRRAAEGYKEIVQDLSQRYSDFEISLVTDIEKENLESIKNLMNAGYKIKHIEGNNIRFSVSREEYIETITSKTPGGVPEQIVWSNDPQIIGQAIRMFQALWKQGQPAQNRIRQIESDEPASVMEVIYDPAKTKEVYLQMVEQAQSELLLLLPSLHSFHRQKSVGAIDSILKAAKRGVRIVVLSPLDYQIRNTFPSSDVRLSPFDDERGGSNKVRGVGYESSLVSIWPIPQAKTREGVTILITDRRSSLVIEEKEPSEMDFMKTTGLSTYTTSQVSVRSNVRFVERMMEFVETAQKMEDALDLETISRRQAQLMQDILTHDIRNYNQITRANVELLQQRLTDETLKQFADSAIASIDGSTELIQKARLLSGIMMEREPRLRSIDLSESLDRSLSLVKQVYRSKTLQVTYNAYRNSMVLADSLLDEVFVNILTNAVKYTDEPTVPLLIDMETGVDGQRREQDRSGYWRVIITDYGRGIPDELKKLGHYALSRFRKGQRAQPDQSN